MTECPTCGLFFVGDLCPNQWRDHKGETVDRGPAKHEAARVSIEGHRTARATLGLDNSEPQPALSARPGTSFSYYVASRNADLTEGRGGQVTLLTTVNEQAAYEACKGWGVQGRGDGSVTLHTMSVNPDGTVTKRSTSIYGDITNERGIFVRCGWKDGRDTP